MPPITIRPAAAADAAALSAFAARMFAGTFGADNTPEDVALYLAGALMDATLGAARARGARTLWLGVWERNPRAVRFYEKCGFRRVGEHAFALGRDVQTDWIMSRAVGG